MGSRLIITADAAVATTAAKNQPHAALFQRALRILVQERQTKDADPGANPLSNRTRCPVSAIKPHTTIGTPAKMTAARTRGHQRDAHGQ